MKLQTFRASTMSEALAQVKGAMGQDAVILHTRTIHTRRWLGLRRHEAVEITAGRGVNVGADRNGRVRLPRTGSVPAGAYARQQPRGADSSARTSRESAPVLKPQVVSGPRSLLDTPAAGHVALLTMSQEVAQLKAAVGELVRTAKKSAYPPLPENLLEYYTRLIGNDVAEEIAADVLRAVQEQSRPDQLANPAFVRARVAEQIERLLPVAGEIRRTKTDGPHVVALVGPTGVGKTTTLAKLAANLKLREKHRVGLITLDTYRIAAVDQLRKYAEIIGAPLRVVSTAAELREAIAELSDCDYVLIDTAGRSPNDTLKLSELKGLIAAAGADEVHLVLSATASRPCVQLAVERFGEVRVDKVIFTKIDEAAHVGVVLDVVRSLKKRLSYVTTGQDVPDDIEVGQSRRLADLILGTPAPVGA